MRKGLSCREWGIAHTRSHAALPLANLPLVDFEAKGSHPHIFLLLRIQKKTDPISKAGTRREWGIRTPGTV